MLCCVTHSGCTIHVSNSLSPRRLLRAQHFLPSPHLPTELVALEVGAGGWESGNRVDGDIDSGNGTSRSDQWAVGMARCHCQLQVWGNSSALMSLKSFSVASYSLFWHSSRRGDWHVFRAASGVLPSHV